MDFICEPHFRSITVDPNVSSFVLHCHSQDKYSYRLTHASNSIGTKKSQFAIFGYRTKLTYSRSTYSILQESSIGHVRTCQPFLKKTKKVKSIERENMCIFKILNEGNLGQKCQPKLA